MSVRIAIATTDGKVVNEHFGRARHFSIVELDENSHRFLERREALPLCSGGEHSESAVADAIALLWDCKAVLVAKAGVSVKRALEISGVSVFEIGMDIHEALAKLRKYYFSKTKN